MDEDPQHQTIVLVDVEGFSDPRRTLPFQREIRRELYRVVEGTLEAAGVPPSDCHFEDRGDGMLILVPPQHRKMPLVEILHTTLAWAVDSSNDGRDPALQMRLRLAVHAGEVVIDEHGATSTSLTTAFRLLDAEPLKEALANSQAIVAMIVSPFIFDEVVRHSDGLNAASFRPVRVKAKNLHGNAWIALTDKPYPPDIKLLSPQPSSDTASAQTSSASAKRNMRRKLMTVASVAFVLIISLLIYYFLAASRPTEQFTNNIAPPSIIIDPTTQPATPPPPPLGRDDPKPTSALVPPPSLPSPVTTQPTLKQAIETRIISPSQGATVPRVINVSVAASESDRNDTAHTLIFVLHVGNTHYFEREINPKKDVEQFQVTFGSKELPPGKTVRWELNLYRVDNRTCAQIQSAKKTAESNKTWEPNGTPSSLLPRVPISSVAVTQTKSG